MKRRLALAALATAGGAAAQAVDTDLPGYDRVNKLAGTVKAAGSSTVAALLKPVTDRFAALQPEVAYDISGAGSSTALAALLESPEALGLLSRAMNARERERFASRWGRAPLELKIAVDAVAVYVFKANPVPALGLRELRRAFGRDPDAAERWGELGATGDWAARPLVRYGLEAGRGAHELVRELVLEGSDFAASLTVEPVSTSVVQGVATQPGGIGYASVYFRTARTRVLPILHRGQAVEPSADNARAGHYPLARFLYVIANQPPPAAQQVLRYLLSRGGQEAVAAQGFYPLDAALARQGLAALERGAS